MGRPNQLPQDIKEYGKASWTTAKNRYMRETIIGPRQKDQYRLVICMAGKHPIAIELWKKRKNYILPIFFFRMPNLPFDGAHERYGASEGGKEE